MTKTLKALQKKVEMAKDQLEKAIFAEMDRVARKYKLSKMEFLAYGTHLYRNDKKIDDVDVQTEIVDLERLYMDFVHDAGFGAIWKSDEGWE